MLKQTLKKVPEITLIFWLVKLLTTGMGEVTSDFLAHLINPIFAVLIAGGGLVIALALQFASDHYQPWRYWLCVTMVAIFGTMVADVMHVGLGIPYLVSTLFFLGLLLIFFGCWFSVEKNLSIHSIFTFRREVFYWSTVLVSFAFGTAIGDLTASTWQLGYFVSGLLFAVLMIIPVIGYKKLKMPEVLSFWFAYILTRPLGASFADWFGRARNLGGLGVGTGWVSLLLTVTIFMLIGVMTRQNRPKELN